MMKEQQNRGNRPERKAGRELPLMLVLLLFLMGSLLAGCGKKNPVSFPESEENILFRVGDRTAEPEEWRIYRNSLRQEYSSIYGEGIWTADSGLEESIGNECLARLSRVKALTELAEQLNISLEESERQQVEEMAAGYMQYLPSGESGKTDGLYSLLKKMYGEYSLAEKTYSSIVSAEKIEISEDEARTARGRQLFFAKEPGAGSRAEEALEKLRNREKVSGMTEYIIDREDPELAEAAFALQPGECSEVLETGEGFVILQCDTNFDRELTEARKRRLLEQREQEAFTMVYDPFAASLECSINRELLDKIEKEELSGNHGHSFFEIYKSFSRNRGEAEKQ